MAILERVWSEAHLIRGGVLSFVMLIPGTHIERAHMHSHGRASDKERCALAHALTGHADQTDDACALGLWLKCKRT